MEELEKLQRYIKRFAKTEAEAKELAKALYESDWSHIYAPSGKYYVYTYAYPVSMGGAIFYVGKGTGNRIYAHEWDAKTSWDGSEKAQAIRRIWDKGEEVVKSIVFRSDDSKEAREYEQRLIAEIGFESLTNQRLNKNASTQPLTRYRKDEAIQRSRSPYSSYVHYMNKRGTLTPERKLTPDN
jgi:hypothetical protein